MLRYKALILGVLLLLALSACPHSVFASCVALPTNRGNASLTITVPSTTTYRVWSRIYAPNTVDNSFLMQIDQSNCNIVVGDAQIQSGAYSWVDYQSGNSSNKVTVSLSAGTHTLYVAGREDNVELDKVLLLADTGCVPTGVGTNCTGTGSGTTSGSATGSSSSSSTGQGSTAASDHAGSSNSTSGNPGDSSSQNSSPSVIGKVSNAVDRQISIAFAGQEHPVALGWLVSVGTALAIGIALGVLYKFHKLNIQSLKKLGPGRLSATSTSLVATPVSPHTDISLGMNGSPHEAGAIIEPEKKP